MTPPALRYLRRLLVGALALAVVTGCTGGSDRAEPAGASSARAVVDAHVAAYRAYDLAAACELLSPARRAEMARMDGAERDGYCVTATADVVASATPATRARTRATYTDPKVTRLDRSDGPWFRIESADGSYAENLQVTQIDGRWWVAQVESDLDSAD